MTFLPCLSSIDSETRIVMDLHKILVRSACEIQVTTPNYGIVFYISIRIDSSTIHLGNTIYLFILKFSYGFRKKNYSFFVTFSQMRKNKSECCSLRITFGLTFDVEFDFLCRRVIQIQMKICSEFCIFQLLINMSNSYQKYTGS